VIPTADKNTITSIASWFETAKPKETRSVRDIQVQTGCHFEEVHEMLMEIDGLDGETRVLLANAKLAMHALAEHLKKSTDVVFMIDEANHVNYLDALCDQIVTATGVAHFMNYNVADALNEVDRSNWSKFIDGQCIKDANGKIAKGPDYFKADLLLYID
jgi:hypothetical protein